jgi:hypothetical protein
MRVQLVDVCSSRFFGKNAPAGHSPRAKRTARQLLLLSIYNENASERASSYTAWKLFLWKKAEHCFVV